MKNKKIVCVIPARLNAQRFPKKLLSTLAGKPLLEWVWNAATAVKIFSEITFAIDDLELAQTIESFGGSWIMTSATCNSGTDRLVELHEKKLLTADIWVNWQGDEPFIHEKMIAELLQSCDIDSATGSADVWTLKKKITRSHELTALNIAKVVCDARNNALYFSRSLIPCFRDEQNPEKLLSMHTFYKHVGLYAYTSQALTKISQMGNCPLEDAEKLEQLRHLYYGLRIKVHTTEYEVIGIDTPADLARAEQRVMSVTQQDSPALSV